MQKGQFHEHYQQFLKHRKGFIANNKPYFFQQFQDPFEKAIGTFF